MCSAKHSLTLVQSAFKRDFDHLYISPASLRYAKDEDTLVCFSLHFVALTSSSELLPFAESCMRPVGKAFQCIHSAATVLLVLAHTVNTIVAVGNLKIMLAVRRIIAREMNFNTALQICKAFIREKSCVVIVEKLCGTLSCKQ